MDGFVAETFSDLRELRLAVAAIRVGLGRPARRGPDGVQRRARHLPGPGPGRGGPRAGRAAGPGHRGELWRRARASSTTSGVLLHEAAPEALGVDQAERRPARAGTASGSSTCRRPPTWPTTPPACSTRGRGSSAAAAGPPRPTSARCAKWSTATPGDGPHRAAPCRCPAGRPGAGGGAGARRRPRSPRGSCRGSTPASSWSRSSSTLRAATTSRSSSRARSSSPSAASTSWTSTTARSGASGWRSSRPRSSFARRRASTSACTSPAATGTSWASRATSSAPTRSGSATSSR